MNGVYARDSEDREGTLKRACLDDSMYRLCTWVVEARAYSMHLMWNLDLQFHNFLVSSSDPMYGVAVRILMYTDETNGFIVPYRIYI